jgi:hypothetical protein
MTMTFDKSEEAVLNQAASFQLPSARAKKKLWIAFVCVAICSIAGALTKPNAVEAWAFAVVTIGAFGGVVQYALFRVQALALIHKLHAAQSRSA